MVRLSGNMKRNMRKSESDLFCRIRLEDVALAVASRSKRVIVT